MATVIPVDNNNGIQFPMTPSKVTSPLEVFTIYYEISFTLLHKPAPFVFK